MRVVVVSNFILGGKRDDLANVIELDGDIFEADPVRQLIPESVGILIGDVHREEGFVFLKMLPELFFTRVGPVRIDKDTRVKFDILDVHALLLDGGLIFDLPGGQTFGRAYDLTVLQDA